MTILAVTVLTVKKLSFHLLPIYFPNASLQQYFKMKAILYTHISHTCHTSAKDRLLACLCHSGSHNMLRALNVSHKPWRFRFPFHASYHVENVPVSHKVRLRGIPTRLSVQRMVLWLPRWVTNSLCSAQMCVITLAQRDVFLKVACVWHIDWSPGEKVSFTGLWLVSCLNDLINTKACLQLHFWNP